MYGEFVPFDKKQYSLIKTLKSIQTFQTILSSSSVMLNNSRNITDDELSIVRNVYIVFKVLIKAVLFLIK